jgi:FAD synthetase
MHTTHATDADPQNGSAHESARNGTKSTSIHADENIPPLPIVIERIHARVQEFLAESHPPDSLLASVQRSTRTSLEVVASAVAQYKLSGLSLSYNGGKDCLVLLILFLAGLHPYASHADSISKDTKSSANNPMIPAIYALPPDPFPEVEDFVVSSAQAYHLSITKYTTAPPHTTLRSSFEDYLALHPDVRAIFVGTRRTDPHGAKLSHFDRTDGGWPDFMRIHPVIDWHYAEIWAFIRHLGLEYCQLYDMGYTSLGGTSDTLPNPRLKLQDEKEGGEGGYLPAYELVQDLEERLGRN